MSRNSFKELEKMEMENFEPSIQKIKTNVDDNVNVFRFLGDMVELFIPKVIGLVTCILGSDDKNLEKSDSRYPNLRG